VSVPGLRTVLPMHASVLKYFVEVARCGSVRRASENLYVAASAVNRQILKLEDELGGELFDRMPNGMRLNAAGERLLRHVQSTLHDFQVMRSELDALKGERTGHVKLASMDSFFVDFLPGAIEEFSEAYPAVTYTIASYAPMEVVPQLQSGRLRALAVTGAKPLEALPSLPTVTASGLPGYQAQGWFGLLAPKATPPALVAKLHDDVAKVLAMADVRKDLIAKGADPGDMSAAEFGRFIAEEQAKWAKLVKDAGIVME